MRSIHPNTARYDYLKDLPEGDQKNPIDEAVIQAMKDIEKYVVSLKDTLPKNKFMKLQGKDNVFSNSSLNYFRQFLMIQTVTCLVDL